MAKKPTYEELSQRVKELEIEILDRHLMQENTTRAEELPTNNSELKINPEIQIQEVDLGSIINAAEIQSIMDDFYYLTNMVTAVLDLKGKVIENTGWQEICTKFHRIHPGTARNCTKSDLFLAKNLKPGEYVDYKCKNGLWDVVTPLYVGTKHLGNIYTGQFFYDDEQIDENFFAEQAEKHGFDKDSYLGAFRRIPRYSRETVSRVMSFLVKFTTYISRISLLNIQLEKEIRERRQVDEALRESETHLRALIRTIPDLVWFKDQRGIYLFCNAKFERFFGAPEKDIIGKTDHDFVDKKLADFFQKQDKAAIDKGRPLRNEEEVIYADDGHHEILETVKTPMYRSDGQLAGVLGIGRDITERKQAEVNLSQSERLLNNIIDQNPYPIWISNEKGTLVRINKACCDLLNIREAEVVGKYNVLKDDIVIEHGFLPLVQSVFSDGRIAKFTIEYNSGRLKQLELDRTVNIILETTISPVKDKSNTITNAVIMHRDITEKRLSREELLRAKDYAEKLIESANAMIVVLDAGGRVQVFNKAAEEITGYTRQEVLGHNWFEMLVPKDQYQSVLDAFRRSARGGLPRSFENPILTKAGEERFISWQNTELLENGVHIGAISFGIDITERKHLENQLLQSQKMEAIGQLTGGIAHDFNNMLSVILGHAELVKSSLSLGDPLLKSVLEIENAGLHSRDITRQLLAFSRKQIIAPKTTNLNDLIENIKKTLAKLIGENIELRFIPQSDLWYVRFDPTQIDQILINLSINARDAMPNGGTLTIETSNANLDAVYCTSHVECRPGPYVVLTVADDGVGMDKKTLSHAFEPFYTTKEVGKGTGLGLATIYGIVKQNGGFINIYSEPGKGSTFSIHIPRLMEKVEKEKVAEETPPEFHPAKVLLVEDDDMVRKMTAAILKKIGYSVLIAETPIAALTFFKKEVAPIDLLITDVVMPQMSGEELVAKIRLIKPEVKVLYMSGYPENIIVRRGVLKEGIHFVQKPFSVNDFARKIRETIEDK